jgi:hypothetical protein
MTAPLVAIPQSTAAKPKLTNLRHLDFLGTEIRPPRQSGHETYQLDSEPAIGVLWTYAERQNDGSFRRVGGGVFDPATGHYGQGAFNTDDIARACVVYVRDWQQNRTTASRRKAYQLLRGLTYLQTISGSHAGNPLLWMQSDGTLTPSATPPDNPDPSDSGPSYWLARSIWALGEGYAAFRSSDRKFATFLRTRLDLAVSALQRQVLVRYGDWEVSDGKRVPGWLIYGAADASSEAVLGLAAYVRAGGGSTARTALAQLAEGIAALSAGDAKTWPYGAILPATNSRSIWHAWAAQMPTALAVAATALGRPGWLETALRDAAGFTPALLTAGGCDNGWLPAPIDRSQIAYGVDARLQALLTIANTTGRDGLRRLAAVAAAWYFGANRAGQPMYEPATGVTFDGLSADGSINRNSGAESTIHGQLSMLALDRAGLDSLTRIVSRDGLELVEAETGKLAGGAAAMPADPAYTGEYQWSGGSYAMLPAAGSVSWMLPAGAQQLLVRPIVELTEIAARTSWHADGAAIGTINHGTAGAQGISPAPGTLLPVSLTKPVPAGTTLTAVCSTGPVRIDALLVEPVVATLVMAGPGAALALLRNGDQVPHIRSVTLPGTGPVVIETYDNQSRPYDRQTSLQGTVLVDVPSGGFATVTRRNRG